MLTAFRLVGFSFAAWVGSYIYSIYKSERERKQQETKKGWHEDHSKVEKLDYPHREKLIKRIMIPRIRIGFSVLIRN